MIMPFLPGTSARMAMMRAGYEAAVRSAGKNPTGEHSWENQHYDCKMDWQRIIRAVIDSYNEFEKEAADACQIRGPA